MEHERNVTHEPKWWFLGAARPFSLLPQASLRLRSLSVWCRLAKCGQMPDHQLRLGRRAPRDKCLSACTRKGRRAPRENACRAPRENACRAPRENACRAPRAITTSQKDVRRWPYSFKSLCQVGVYAGRPYIQRPFAVPPC